MHINTLDVQFASLNTLLFHISLPGGKKMYILIFYYIHHINAEMDIIKLKVWLPKLALVRLNAQDRTRQINNLF